MAHTVPRRVFVCHWGVSGRDRSAKRGLSVGARVARLRVVEERAGGALEAFRRRGTCRVRREVGGRAFVSQFPLHLQQPHGEFPNNTERVHVDEEEENP